MGLEGSELKVGLLGLGEVGEQLLVGVEEFLVLVGDEQLELLRELDLVYIHADFYALGVAFLVEVLVVAAQKGEVQVRVVKCVDGDAFLAFVLY